MLLLLFVLLFMSAGIPVAWSLGLSSFAFMLLKGIPFNALTVVPTTSIGNFILVAVPLFILTGEIMNNGGITRRIIHFCTVLIGQISGGLAHVNILASIVFAGMSGSAYGDAAGLGTVLIHAMKKQGYKPEYAAAVTAASSTIGPIVPPSIAMVIYGSITGTSIGGLFLGGFIPGFLVGGSLILLTWIIGKRNSHPRFNKASFLEIIKATLIALPALFLPVLIIWGIVSGWTTPTEAASIAVAYSLLLSVIIYRELSFKELWSVFQSSLKRTAGVMMLIAFASIFGWLAIREQIPFAIAQYVLSLSESPIIFLLLTNILILVLGMFMETIAIMLLIVPVLFPVIKLFSIDPVHFGVVIILNLMIGLVTPPLGICLYIVTDIAKVPFGSVVKETIPFLIPLVIVLLLIIIFPSIVLFVPNLFNF